MRYLTAIDNLTIHAWNKYMTCSREDESKWLHLYLLFAMERDTVACVL